MRMLSMALAMATTVAVTGLASAHDNKTTTDKVKMMDVDMDGRVSQSEFTATGKTDADFAKIDVNGDGYVNAAEMEVGEERGPTAGEKKDTRASAYPQPTTVPKDEPTDDNKP